MEIKFIELNLNRENKRILSKVKQKTEPEMGIRLRIEFHLPIINCIRISLYFLK